MARHLTQQAVDEMMNNSLVYGKVCDALDVKPVSLPKLIQRNSSRLSHYDVVTTIASAMKKKPDEILEQKVTEPAA